MLIYRIDCIFVCVVYLIKNFFAQNLFSVIKSPVCFFLIGLSICNAAIPTVSRCQLLVYRGYFRVVTTHSVVTYIVNFRRLAVSSVLPIGLYIVFLSLNLILLYHISIVLSILFFKKVVVFQNFLYYNNNMFSHINIKQRRTITMIYNNNTDDIMKKIKHIMLDKDIKQIDLVHKTGLTKGTISNLLNCKSKNLTLDTL